MKRYGFTLIELMIVVLVIMIIMAIAIPSLIQSRRAANESSAIQSLRAIATSESMFRTQVNRPHPVSSVGQYGSLSQLGGAVPPFVDTALTLGSKAGYTFTVNLVDDRVVPSYFALAGPASYPASGTRSFFVDPSGTVRFSVDGTPADINDSPLN